MNIAHLHDAALARHSVRQYIDTPIKAETTDSLKAVINECNAESGLNIQLISNEPKAFGGFMARYGKFSGVSNYIALVGQKNESLDELCGYYGEIIVLEAQRLGLNTCWAGLTYSKIPNTIRVEKGEKLALVISLGYGVTQGVQSPSKSMDKVARLHGNEPTWFLDGVKAALLAPTAMNQRKFYFEYIDGKVSAKTKWGFYSVVDLGIAKLHFEIGAGKENVIWL